MNPLKNSLSAPARAAARGPNWALLAAIGIPAAAIVASFVTLALAVWRPMTELPSAYHWEGDRLDRDLARAQYAGALDVQARLAVVPAEHLCRIAFSSNAAPPAALVLTLVHSTLRELDSRITLRPSGDGYAGPCNAPRSGHWHAELTDQAGTWMIRREISGWSDSLEFSGRAPAGSAQ